jgi:hypothetical protein
MKRLPRATAALALLWGVDPVRAACPLDQVLVEGMVVSSADGAPVAGASIEAGWNERAAGRMGISRESGADGTFSLRIAFDTYSGRTLTGRDLCEAALQQLDLRVTHPRFRAASRTLPRADLAQPLRIELAPAN